MAAKPRGFTLVEMLVVVAIIAILASILLPTARHFMGLGDLAETEMLVVRIQQAQESYKAEHGSYLLPVVDDPDDASYAYDRRLTPKRARIDAVWPDYSADGRRQSRLYVKTDFTLTTDKGSVDTAKTFTALNNSLFPPRSGVSGDDLKTIKELMREKRGLRDRRTMMEILNDHGAGIPKNLVGRDGVVNDAWGRPLWCGLLEFYVEDNDHGYDHPDNTKRWAGVDFDRPSPWHFVDPLGSGHMDRREWLARGFKEGDLVVFSEGRQGDSDRRDRNLIIFDRRDDTGMRGYDEGTGGGLYSPIRTHIDYGNLSATDWASVKYITGGGSQSTPMERERQADSLSAEEEPLYPAFRIRPGADRLVPLGGKRWMSTGKR